MATTLRISEPTIGTAEMDAVQLRLADGELTQNGGRTVAQFERAIADYCNVDPASVVACASGTAALHIALLQAGLKPGQLVLTPSLTYVATVAAIRYCGAVPVFVDVDPYTWTITEETVDRAVRDLPDHQRALIRGLVPVHLYGVLAPMGALLDMGARYGWWVVDDAAQALGSTWTQATVGMSVGHTLPQYRHPLHAATTFSFYANKLITTGGEGGALICRDPEHARLLRGQGQSSERRYWHIITGYNYRMTAMQAAFGIAQMRQIDTFRSIRALVGDSYRRGLANYVQQHPPINASCADWLFTVLVPTFVDRDRVMSDLAAAGIETRPAFQPIHLMSPYAHCPGGVDNRLPVTVDVAKRGISLPTHCSMTVLDADRVIEAFITAVINQRAAGKEA